MTSHHKEKLEADLRISIKMLILFIKVTLLVPGACYAEGSSAAGEALYKENCETCHGEGLRNPGSSFDLRQLKENEFPRFERSVLNGKGQMPPWKGTLSSQDLTALWDYIRDNAEN